MYEQKELFGRFEHRGWDERLGKGLYSIVYGNPKSQWVIKVGENDGTRAYLEWVMLRTKQGRRMKGMPVIDWLVPLGEGKYMVAMKRLYDARSVNLPTPEYITELANAFECETSLSANDLHQGNIMKSKPGGDSSTLVLTDPSSDSYRPLGTDVFFRDDFELAIQ